MAVWLFLMPMTHYMKCQSTFDHFKQLKQSFQISQCTFKHSKSEKSKRQSLSPVQLFVTPWTVACQVPLSMEFSIQEIWSRLPFPSPEDLPNPGIKPGYSTMEVDSLLSEPSRKPKHSKRLFNFIYTKLSNLIFYFLMLHLQIKLNVLSNALTLTPLTPFFSLSSINNERYSGDLELRLRKYSKSPAIVCLKSLSLLNDSWRKRSNLLFRSNKPFQIKKQKRNLGCMLIFL